MPATEDCRQLAGSDWRKSGIRHAVARITANTVNFSMKFLHSCIPHTWYLLLVSIWPRDSRVLAILQLSTHNENSCLPVLPSRGRNVSNLPFLTTSVTHLHSILACCCIPYFQLSGCRTTHITHINFSSIFFGVVSCIGCDTCYIVSDCTFLPVLSG